MKTLLKAVAAASVLAAGVCFACDGEEHVAVKELTLPQVQALHQASKATFVDANGKEFRAKNGTIPGAVLLTSYSQYEPAKELPQNKAQKLVFYCAGLKCGASHIAAEKALQAGYQDVSVFPGGLSGWKSAGQPTRMPQS